MPAVAPALALVTWAALSLLWSTDPSETMRVLPFWLASLAGFVVAGQVARTPRGLAAVPRAAFRAGGLVALLALVQRATGLEPWPLVGGFGSTFLERTDAAQFLAMVAPFSLLSILRRPGSVAARVDAIGLGLVLAFLAVAGAKSAWLALAAEAALGLMWWRAAARPALPKGARATLGLTLALVAVVAATLPEGRESLPSASRAGLEETDESVNGMQPLLATWRNTLSMIASRPLRGIGLGNFGVVHPRFEHAAAVNAGSAPRRPTRHAHQDFLQVGAELGLVGLGLLGWLAVALFSGLRGRLRSVGATSGLELVLGAASLVGAVTLAAMGFPAYRPTELFLVGIFAALLLLPDRALPAARPLSGGGRMLAALAAALVFALLMPVVARHHLRAARVDHSAWRARVAARQGDWPRVLTAAHGGLTSRPGRADLHFAEARALRHLGRPDEAAATASDGLSSRPHDYLGLVELGRSLKAAGDASAALEVLARAQGLHPRWPQAHAATGRIRFELGELPEAETALSLAVALEDEPAPRARSLLLLCRTRHRDGRKLQALDELERALAAGLPPELDAEARERAAGWRLALGQARTTPRAPDGANGSESRTEGR